MRIIQGEYATTMIDDTYTGNDLTAAERAVQDAHNKMTRAQVQKEFRWSDADFAQALTYGFGAMGYGNPGMDNYRYDRLKVEPWIAELKAFAKRLR